jgi:methylenetetrahydrofolate dehydrogenase (NADP+)/methenyltetrahydrofolate cyclohydrolase/formyltetrahydrofolate synthetase
VAVVVAVNVFATDSEREVELVKAKALAAGATAAVESNHWALGGKGAVALGRAVVESCGKMRAAGSPFKFLYPLELGIAEKFETICSTCRGDGLTVSVRAASSRLIAFFFGSTCD